MAMVRRVSKSNDDSLYGGIDSINNGKFKAGHEKSCTSMAARTPANGNPDRLSPQDLSFERWICLLGPGRVKGAHTSVTFPVHSRQWPRGIDAHDWSSRRTSQRGREVLEADFFLHRLRDSIRQVATHFLPVSGFS
jgi:hypothetical protein